jgi:hypothetical protein
MKRCAVATIASMSLLALSGPPAVARTAARAAPLKSVGAVAVRAASADAVALVDAAGKVTVRRDNGGERRVATPAGCTFAAAGEGRLVWKCATPALHLQVTDLAGEGAVDVGVPDGTGVMPDAIGKTWIDTTATQQQQISPWTLLETTTKLYINWHTGANVWGKDDADATSAIDLDRASLHVKLCGPLRRSDAVRDDAHRDPLAPLAYAKPWAVEEQADKAGTPVAIAIRKCGHADPILLPSSFVDAPFSLSGHWLAWGQKVSFAERALVYLKPLPSGSRFTLRSDLVGIDGIQLTKSSVYVLGARATGDGATTRPTVAVARLR